MLSIVRTGDRKKSMRTCFHDRMPARILNTLTIFIALICAGNVVSADQNEIDELNRSEYSSNLINIRNSNGKLYAYIVLLFNENPHFVNLIQEDSIPLKLMQTED